jgi:hypothetical protein
VSVNWFRLSLSLSLYSTVRLYNTDALYSIIANRTHYSMTKPVILVSDDLWILVLCGPCQDNETFKTSSSFVLLSVTLQEKGYSALQIEQGARYIFQTTSDTQRGLHSTFGKYMSVTVKRSNCIDIWKKERKLGYVQPFQRHRSLTTLLVLIHGAPVSNLGREMNHPDCDYTWFSSASPSKNNTLN